MKDYKKPCERYQNLSKGKKKQKHDNLLANVAKISQEMKNKGLLVIEKKSHKTRSSNFL